jgi:DegV family protein with EDD domain
MSKVTLVTDSTTYLPKEFIDQYSIRVAPAMVIWSGEELRDGVDIQPSEFYSRLRTEREMPTTSQATPAAMKEIFEELSSEGNDILGVFISSKLSGTVASAEQALAMVPDANVEIVDSLSGSMGAGWPILEAAKAAARGADLAECKRIVLEALDHVGIVLMVDTLEYLHRGGRIGGAQRFIGTALAFKPLLEIEEGGFEAVEMVRTRRKALNRLVELLEDRIDNRSPVRLATLHADALDIAKQVLKKATATVHPIETMFSEVSPAVGVHLGPGTVGFAFMAGYTL